MQSLGRRFRLARHWSNIELARVSPLFEGSVCNVSAGTDEDKQGKLYRVYFVRAHTYETTNFSPGSFRGFAGRAGEHLMDLETPAPEHLVGRYDVVFNHTTLEHVFDIHAAFHSLRLLTRDILIVVVPFAQVQHESPGYQDFWRLTPTCLRRLYHAEGLDVIYESCNNDFNAATYLFFIGAVSPGRWEGILPAYVPIQEAAGWIGDEATAKAYCKQQLTPRVPNLIRGLRARVRHIMGRSAAR